jgi:hypothetical protein
MPDWFRKLPAIDPEVLSATNNGLTVKRCMPFLDALSAGFILPIAATVRLEVRDGGRSVTAGWEFDRVMVSNHGSHQIAGHPHAGRPPMKIHNYWTIRTPPGWSCLFVQPLNRHGLPLELVAGIVDTDTYVSPVHFPFIATAEEGVHVIEKGTPLVQVFPFFRETSQLPMEIMAETAETAAERQRVMRATIAGEGWYRKIARAKR